MNLYEIGQFLGFDSLAQRSEDEILDRLCLNNIQEVISWSEQSHGSEWVHRQVVHFLRDNTNAIAAKTEIVKCLNNQMLRMILESDFTQVRSKNKKIKFKEKFGLAARLFDDTNLEKVEQ